MHLQFNAKNKIRASLNTIFCGMVSHLSSDGHARSIWVHFHVSHFFSLYKGMQQDINVMRRYPNNYNIVVHILICDSQSEAKIQIDMENIKKCFFFANFFVLLVRQLQLVLLDFHKRLVHHFFLFRLHLVSFSIVSSSPPLLHVSESPTSNWNLEVGFCGGRKTGGPGVKPSKHRREPTNNSTHIQH